MHETIGDDDARDGSATPLDVREDDELARGASIDRYVILSKLGAGGMGVVYAAYDPELDRKVAIKLLPPETGTGREGASRLLREAQALAKLSHPNIVAIHDVGMRDDDVWLAMEFVAGRTMREWLAAERPAWREVLDVIRPVCLGLAAAHDAGLVHRDVKPDNVMVADDGRVRVMDFGLARSTAADTNATPPSRTEHETRERVSARLTAVGATPGTPAYMSPEQITGDPVDGRSDQFSLCVTLWEALYGERPFAGDSLVELAGNILEGTRRPLPRNVRVPRWIARALVRGLAVDPAARWPSLPAFVDALHRGRRGTHVRIGAVAIASVGALAGTVIVARHVDETRRISACETEGDLMDESWNDESRTAVREGLRATGAGHADTTADNVMPWLDGQAQRWRSARVDTCLAVQVEHTWDEDLASRSQWCLDERREELNALVATLSAAPADVVSQAVVAAAGLAPVAPCQDPDLLARLPAPPAHHRDGVRDVRTLLARARALGLAGEYQEAATASREAGEAATTLDWPPLIAAARTTEGSMLTKLGEYAEAERVLENAYFLAAESGATDQALRAADSLAYLVGNKLARYTDGLRWIRHAELALAQLPDPAGLLRAGVLHDEASIHQAKGEYDRAVELFEQAVELREAALGPDHPTVADSLNNLGNIEDRRGDYVRARAYHERVLATIERTFGPDHPRVASSLNNIAGTYWATGQLDRVRPLMDRALKIKRAALGPDHPEIAISLVNIANVLQAQGKLNEAIVLLRQSLELRERALGPDHPDVAQSLSNLGATLAKTLEFDEAQSMFERALEIRERAFGPDNPEVAESLSHLAAVITRRGDIDTAESLYERALEISERTRGPDHPAVAGTLHNLGMIDLDRGNFARALERHRRALAIREAKRGPNHPEVAQSLGAIARVHQAQGHYEEAARLYERALAIREAAFGDRHPGVANNLTSLASVWVDEGDPERARPLLARAQSIYESTLGTDHPDFGYVLIEVAQVALLRGDIDEARRLATRAIELCNEGLVPAPDLAEARLVFALVLAKAGESTAQARELRDLAQAALVPTGAATTKQLAQLDELAKQLRGQSGRP